jgi:predicted nucleic acid-binding protein
MLAFPCLEAPMSLGVLEEAVDLYRRARRSGVTFRSSIDCLIAAMAIRHGMAVMHRDRDFANLARVSGLKHLAV